MKIAHFVTLLLAICLSQVAVSAPKPAKVVAGWVEKIYISDLPYPLKAKLDTGAMTSSIHATNIEIFKKEKQRWVRFDLHFQTDDGKQVITLERPKERGVKIKDHDDESEKRAVVKLQLCFDGRSHETEFTLTDRSNFIYPILLGRRFLDGVAIVDADQTFLTLSKCPKG